MLAGAGDTYTETTRRFAAGKALNAAAALVLEREGDALARGAHALAEVAGCGLSRSADQALSRALAQASLGRPQIDWLLVDAPDDNIGASTGIHATDLLRAVGDSGAATALTGVALAALVLDAGKVPAGFGLVEPPVAAAVVSADEIGAAAVVLRRITN
jgi:3-oxoacyl-(acyl-carrier-protein) synthase